MSALKTPAPDAPASEWGRLAVSIPGWRWMRGMRAMEWHGQPAGVGAIADETWPDPEDPATAGCLLAMLGPGEWDNVAPGSAIAADGRGWWAWVDGKYIEGLTLGQACIAAAAALGRWPGGEQ